MQHRFSVITSTRTGVLRVFLGTVLAIQMLAVTPTAAQIDSMRVNLFAGHSVDIISTRSPDNGTLHVQLQGNQAGVFVLRDNESLTIRLQDGTIILQTQGRSEKAAAVVLRTKSRTPIPIQVRDQSRTYWGTIRIAPGKETNQLDVINTVALEDYVASVVASELSFDQPEATKAQAVVSRTYALHTCIRAASNGTICELPDNVDSQSYLGAGRETEVARQAAHETKGEILTYRNHPINAVYSSSAGGHTADNETVWNGEPLPYLRAKNDPYDADTPHEEWEFSCTESALHELLSRKYGLTARNVRFRERTESGRYSRVIIEGRQTDKEITANDFRLLVTREFGARSLKSTAFSVSREGGYYIFEGRGFGHGVGMSQWGALARAKNGQSYRDILHFYYTDVNLERMNRRAIAAAMTPDEQNPPRAQPPAPSTRPQDDGDESSGRETREAEERKSREPERRNLPRRPGW